MSLACNTLRQCQEPSYGDPSREHIVNIDDSIMLSSITSMMHPSILHRTS